MRTYRTNGDFGVLPWSARNARSRLPAVLSACAVFALTLSATTANAQSKVQTPGSATGTSGGVAPPGKANLPAEARSVRSVRAAPRPKGVAPDQSSAGAGLDDLQRAVLDRVNQYRTKAGLPPVAANAQLLQAAQAHANYLKDEAYSGHAEPDTASPYFTGADPFARIKAARYAFANAGEVVAQQSTFHPEAAVDALMMAIYHRFIILSSDYTDAGPGAALVDHRGVETLNVTVDFGALTPPPPTGTLVLYPIDRQEGVPADFDPAHESPNPMPGRVLVGYPVSVQTDSIRKLRVNTFAMYEMGENEALSPIETRLLTNDVDAETPTFGAAIIPAAPLKPGTRYRLAFSGSIDGNPVARNWEFTTAAASPVVMEFAHATVPRGGSQTANLRNLDDQMGPFYVCYGPQRHVKSLVQETESELSIALTDACPTGSVCRVQVIATYSSSCAKPFASGSFAIGD